MGRLREAEGEDKVGEGDTVAERWVPCVLGERVSLHVCGQDVL